ncbi:hypothetical protein EMPG_13040 [Blastomyces silverae]|uniref:Uncharacterized protein n=1 Tax=Blastomyces silverae TaxID=2060906 RepID=A0A0H1BRR9_9EURO|nr:hypothetical protein EMPG_13040 [Blastomyces silverae]
MKRSVSGLSATGHIGMHQFPSPSKLRLVLHLCTHNGIVHMSRGTKLALLTSPGHVGLPTENIASFSRDSQMGQAEEAQFTSSRMQQRPPTGVYAMGNIPTPTSNDIIQRIVQDSQGTTPLTLIIVAFGPGTLARPATRVCTICISTRIRSNRNEGRNIIRGYPIEAVILAEEAKLTAHQPSFISLCGNTEG